MLASVTSCVNIREFLKDTTMADSHENVAWKSEFTFFQFLSWLFQLAFFVKCKQTLDLELTFCQPNYPSSWREWILSLLVYVLHRTWNWWQRNVQKSVMHVQVLVLPYQASAHLITHRRCILTSQYIVICQKQNILGANWLLLLIASQTFFRLISSSFASG